MPSVWGWENRAAWFTYTVSLARLPAHNEVGRLRWRKLNGETLSLDDIYVGKACLNQCSLHGHCKVCVEIHFDIALIIQFVTAKSFYLIHSKG